MNMPETQQLQFGSESYEQAKSAFKELCEQWKVPIDGNWADIFGRQLRNWAGTQEGKPIRTLSLFSGAGGLDIGFHDAGFQVTHTVEIEERFSKSLEENAKRNGYIEGTKIVCQDIREFSLPSDAKIDFIIGGPPCQTFSAAGRRAAGVLGTSDQRGTLFEEYVRLLSELQPSGFLFENVYGIVGAEGGEPWRQIQVAFQDAGYKIAWRILDAADYGVAQHRERLIIVGTKDITFRFPRPTHGPDSRSLVPHISAESVLRGCQTKDVVSNSELRGRYGHLLTQIPPGLNYSFLTEEMGHPKPVFAWRSKFSDFLYKADPQRPVRTIKAQGGQYTGPFHWDSRPFHVNELKRLQSFPDDYRIVGGKQVAIHQIGNSVPPQFARILAMSVIQQMFDYALPVELPLLDENQQLGFRKRKRELSKAYKAKANAAIEMLSARAAIAGAKRQYSATLEGNFKWSEDSSSTLAVETRVGEIDWCIAVGADQTALDASPTFVLAVTPRSKNPWGLGATKVFLEGFGPFETVFTAVWKAFEAELVLHEVRADLVQLNGYYQYEPKFVVKVVSCQSDSWMIEGLCKIIEGTGVRKIMPSGELANAVQIDPDKVQEFVRFLKSLGYEARNSETNPQIPADCYLIPYAFPTLSNLSVQLHKNLQKGVFNHDE